MIKPFKRRRFDAACAVRVHRNLNKKGVWWSVLQRGRVVGHTQRIWLRDVVFHVGERGRQRAIKTGQRNVHAWATGVFIQGPLPENIEDIRVGTVHYKPQRDESFVVYWTAGVWEKLESAPYAVFDDIGAHVWKVLQ